LTFIKNCRTLIAKNSDTKHMNLNILNPRKALNKAFLKVKPNRDEIDKFKGNLIELVDHINVNESEEFHKNIISDFLKQTYYGDKHFINTKGRNDLVIHSTNDPKSSVAVILEFKTPANKYEMPTKNNINTKAFQELVLYYLRERITGKNLEIKYLIATNIYEWFIFDAQFFDKEFAQNKTLVKKFTDFNDNNLSINTTDRFYKDIAEPAIKNIEHEITFTYFDFRDYNETIRNSDKKDDTQLIALFKLLSPENLLKLPFANDSNSLDKSFYSELLHIIGLTETKNGSKKLIERKKEGERLSGSLIESAIKQLIDLDKISRLDKPGRFGDNNEERLFNIALELAITWINRILFLKLLEAQLVKYHKGDKSYTFLEIEKVQNFYDLNDLFFSVLAKKENERSDDVKKLFATVPYLNSSLFEQTDIERSCLIISQIKGGKLPLLSSTVIKDNNGKKRTGEMPVLEYIFEFLNAYDFSSEGAEEIQEMNKSLINASVLGLIFEKINGYKDGSFFTPGFITMYMCRETIRRAVVQKFNDAKGWKCNDLMDVYNKIEDKKEANEIINTLKICDPAVGSGHFLVSALNEIIAIKSELKILFDRNGKRLKEYHVEVVNDELIITDEEGDFFEYNPKDKESQRVQEALFHEKETIIENCLFGVDLNPNSVKICRLRLWIELLKNAYYHSYVETLHATSLHRGSLETLPNIDINIKCGNSLISRYPLDADIKQALKKSKWNIDSYRLAVMSYRNAQSKDEKRDMEKLIDTIKNDFEFEVNKNDKRIFKLKTLSDELFNLNNQTSMFEKTKAEKAKWNKDVKALTENIQKLELEIEEIKTNKIYENAFEWRFEFPEVLNDEGDFVGFDVVIGNPPYGIISNKIQKSFLLKNYLYTDYQLDIYMLFVELAERILKANGKLNFIIPNTWLLNLITPNIRYLFFNKFDLMKIKAYETPVFEEAVVDTLIVIANKNKFSKKELEIEIEKRDKSLFYNKFDKIKLSENYKNPVNIYLSHFASNILKLTKSCKNLEEIAKITQGTKPFQIGKGIPKQTEKTLKEKPFIKDYKADKTFKPLLRGSLMNRYSNIWNENYYISFGDWLAEPRYSACYDVSKKIITRQTGSDLISTIDYEKFIVRDNLYTIISKNAEYIEEYLLGLLNSKFLNWYYQNIINNEVGEALAQVKRGHLCILPVAFPKELFSKKIIKIVSQILKAKKKNSAADTSALEKEIDLMVYKLYDLTYDEVKIVDPGFEMGKKEYEGK
jgi:adenine-specific DNA-methyltransferase